MPHKLVLDAGKAVMAANFNAEVAALAANYPGQDPPVIGWGSGSTSVFYGNLTAGGDVISQLSAAVELLMWPGEALWTGETKGVKWSGRVNLHLQFRIRKSHRANVTDAIERDETLSLASAIFRAVIEVFCDETTDWSAYGVVLAALPSSPEWPEVAQTDDGWEQIVPVVIQFKTDIPKS